MSEKLYQLRAEIDGVDEQLLDLLEKRLKLVNDVGKIKSAEGLPLHDPVREIEMIARHREKAKAKGISPDFIEDILRRLMQESYSNELTMDTEASKPNERKIIVIGGRGKMGALFCKQFILSGYQVEILEDGDDYSSPEVFSGASLVLVTVPLAKTLDVINHLPKLPSDCVLADLTSIKADPLAAMLKVHDGPVVGLHPMFGPRVKTLVKQVIIQCDGRSCEQYGWLIDQIKLWGGYMESCSAKEHDQFMSYIQALRHFTSFVYGCFLLEEQVDLNKVLAFSSPIYRLELSMVGRMFSQSPELYADIILSSKDNLAVINRHLKEFSNEFNELSHDGREYFINRFVKVSQYLEKYASVFQFETDNILELALKQKR
jgi:chorismate mutase / prephenate dehydrogenase